MKAIWCIPTIFCLLAGDLLACRYTVRDTGFVDLEPPRYRLRLYTDTGSAEALESAARLHTALSDSNIAVEVVSSNGNEVPFLPAAVMESLDGRELLLPGFEGDQARRILEEAVLTPKREEILLRNLDAFCVILLIRGDDGARQVIMDSMEKIRPLLPTMDKPYHHPPALVEISEDLLEQERILLFSLGLDAEAINGPRAVVLYGRGRRMGPVLSGDLLNETSILNLLRLIGTDCECGIDLSELKGPAIPHRWDEEMQARAAATLGFDPENPMVKLEVSQILAQSSEGRSAGTLFDEDPLFGYSEQRIELDEPAEDPPANERPSVPVVAIIIIFLLVVGLWVAIRSAQGR